MPRQSISFTSPNEAWLKAQVESEEFSSKSDVVNDLIRKARDIESIRARLMEAEQSGFISVTRAGLLEELKKEARADGDLQAQQPR